MSFGDRTGRQLGARASVDTATPITLTVPQPPPGFTFNTQPCANGGIMNVPTPITVTVTDLGTGCNSAFTNGFLLSPSDATCRNQTPPTPPTASFTATPINGHTMQFADTSTATGGATIVSRTWDFGDGSPVTAANSQQNPSHDYTASGPFPKNFSVKLTVTDSKGLSNQTVKVITVTGP